MLPDLYQNAAFMLVLAGMLGVSYVTDLEVGSLGGIVLILLRALTYSRAMQSVFHQVNETTPYVQALDTERADYQRDALVEGRIPLARVDKIRFDDVNFSYEPGNPVLQGLSFEVDRGESVGIVGPSGSGKSTLVQILLRLRLPETGRYLINGDDAASYSEHDWYQRFALVSQDSRLFRGTVGENIRFFRSEVTQADIERAATMAHIHEDITSWPMGYETQVGTRGIAVSGGQKQRICIARALIGQPDVLVLDEPTSSLDLRSESLIQDTLTSLRGRVTIFIVAHRLSTLNICDRIMVFKAGELQAFDPPSILLESNQFYQEALRLAAAPMR